MKKSILMGLALVAALAFVSCKSSESSYRKAYEKAKAQEMAQTNTTDQVETAPVTVTLLSPHQSPLQQQPTLRMTARNVSPS